MSIAVKVPSEEIVAFRHRHGLDQADLDRLFGVNSKGRATRRWEADGGPFHVKILMAYADAYGLELMERLAVERERAAS